MSSITGETAKRLGTNLTEGKTTGTLTYLQTILKPAKGTAQRKGRWQRSISQKVMVLMYKNLGNLHSIPTVHQGPLGQWRGAVNHREALFL